MINATEFYKENKSDGMKSPGMWLQLKTTKEQLENVEYSDPSKDDNGDWQFDDTLFSIYKYYLLLEQEESKTEDKPDMQNETFESKHWTESLREEYLETLHEEITSYIDQKFIERATGQSNTSLRRLGVEDSWKDSSYQLKLCHSTVMAAALTEFAQFNRRIDTHRLDQFLANLREFTAIHLTLSDGVMFENDKIRVVYNNRRRLVSEEKE